MILRLLATTLAAAMAFVAAAVPAQAAPTSGLKCDRYYNTGFGPVALCTQDTGSTGRIGFHSALTNTFSPKTNFMRFIPDGRYKFGYEGVRATDGVVGSFLGYGKFETPYGAAIWGDQAQPGRGRWGVFNLVTNRFYPDGDWMTYCCRVS